eukprot:7541012-Alexandrium_andersonii.AAC.1
MALRVPSAPVVRARACRSWRVPVALRCRCCFISVAVPQLGDLSSTVSVRCSCVGVVGPSASTHTVVP